MFLSEKHNPAYITKNPYTKIIVETFNKKFCFKLFKNIRPNIFELCLHFDLKIIRVKPSEQEIYISKICIQIPKDFFITDNVQITLMPSVSSIIWLLVNLSINQGRNDWDRGIRIPNTTNGS